MQEPIGVYVKDGFTFVSCPKKAGLCGGTAKFQTGLLRLAELRANPNPVVKTVHANCGHDFDVELIR
jgi:hypothetical protein